MLAYNPLDIVINAFFVFVNGGDIDPSSFGPSGSASILTNLAFELSTQLYMLLMLRYMRLEDSGESCTRGLSWTGFFKIYYRDIAVVLIPSVVKAALGWFLGVTFDFNPFANMMCAAYILLSVPFNKYMVILGASILFVSLLDSIALACIYWSVKETRAWLASIPYAPNRPHQLGYRFFVTHTIACYFCFCLLSFVNVASTPIDRYVYEYDRWEEEFRHVDGSSTGIRVDYSLIIGQTYGFSLGGLIIFVWALELAIAYQPAGNSKQHQEILSLQYYPEERDVVASSGHSISNYFCLQTCVQMLNYSKLAYSSEQNPEVMPRALFTMHPDFNCYTFSLSI